MSPDSTVKISALVAAGTSNTLIKTNTLLSHGYGAEEKEDKYSCITDQQSCHYADHYNCLADRVSPKFLHKYNRLRKDEPRYTSQG